MTFAEFLEEMPGLTEYARAIYLRLDADAARIGAAIAARGIDYRARASEYALKEAWWLAGVNRELAEALESDCRKAAMRTLYAAAEMPDGIGRTWVNWYSDLLDIHIRRERERPPLRLVKPEAA